MSNTETGTFDAARIAEGYKKRPYLHPQVMETFHRDKNQVYKNGLDIGCGAGLSSLALGEICAAVTGIDISPNMIEAAKVFCGSEGKYQFYVGTAECIPNEISDCDIVTAAGVVQWVKVADFLESLKIRMQPNAPLLIYDFAISDEIDAEVELKKCYANWWHEEYLKEFPRPARDDHEWTEDEVRPHGFTFCDKKEIRLYWTFTLETFAEFMLIQSNVNKRVEGGELSLEEAKSWFYRTLEPIFNGKESLRMVFKGYLWEIAYTGI